MLRSSMRGTEKTAKENNQKKKTYKCAGLRKLYWFVALKQSTIVDISSLFKEEYCYLVHSSCKWGLPRMACVACVRSQGCFIVPQRVTYETSERWDGRVWCVIGGVRKIPPTCPAPEGRPCPYGWTWWHAPWAEHECDVRCLCRLNHSAGCKHWIRAATTPQPPSWFRAEYQRLVIVPGHPSIEGWQTGVYAHKIQIAPRILMDVPFGCITMANWVHGSVRSSRGIQGASTSVGKTKWRKIWKEHTN